MALTEALLMVLYPQAWWDREYLRAYFVIHQDASPTIH